MESVKIISVKLIIKKSSQINYIILVDENISGVSLENPGERELWRSLEF